MPASVAIHAAVFTAGVLLGGGITAAVASKNRQQQRLSDHAPLPPAMDIVTTTQPGALTVTSGVLKYGNPGARQFSRLHTSLSDAIPGPISDTLIRKAYVAAYDRRLRHPAWVSTHNFSIYFSYLMSTYRPRNT